MTVIYDIENHAKLLFRLHGTVWCDVLPFCMMNSFLTYVVYYLEGKGYKIGLDKQGHGYLSILISFLVVARIGIAYGRLWEANTHLKAALSNCKNLCSYAQVFSGQDTSSNARIWRYNIKVKLIKLLENCMSSVQDESKTVNLVMGRGSKDSDRFGDLTRVPSRVQLTDPYQLSLALQVAIQLEDTHLKRKLHFLEKNSLMMEVTQFMTHFHALTKFATTPIPFPIVQMARTITFFWIFTLPLTLSRTMEKPNYCAAFVFFITYSFVGLELVAMELHDPFGDDDNDLNINQYVKSAVDDIKIYFDEDRSNFFVHDMDKKLPSDCGPARGGTESASKVDIMHFLNGIINTSFLDPTIETTPLLQKI